MKAFWAGGGMGLFAVPMKMPCGPVLDLRAAGAYPTTGSGPALPRHSRDTA